MIKDVTVVSLSRGILGESFIKHELDIGVRRLERLGLNVRFSEHALAGLDFIAAHPEKRAGDLLAALKSDTDMILCAVGGDDGYRLLPYLFENDELKNAAADKIFLGFSDTTVHHFMLHKAGMKSFYGQAFLPDVCELAPDMLPYTKRAFEELIRTGGIHKITPAGIWYDPREDFSPAAVGTVLPSHLHRGWELLQGAPVFSGEILGGCIDTVFDMFDNGRYEDSVRLCERYGLFPGPEDWRGRILLLESSEEQATPENYRRMLRALKSTGIFPVLSGVLIGKPYGGVYEEEYKSVLRDELAEFGLPVLFGLNVGHSAPRAIVPFGVPAAVDAINQEIVFE